MDGQMDDRTYGWNDASRRPLLYVMLGDALAIVYQKKKKEKKKGAFYLLQFAFYLWEWPVNNKR